MWKRVWRRSEFGGAEAMGGADEDVVGVRRQKVSGDGRGGA